MIELAGRTKEVDLLKGDVKSAKEVETWKAGDPIWLDEFRWFVKKLPSSPKNLMLDDFNATIGPRGAEISHFEGFADDIPTIDKLEKDLREPGRKVEALTRTKIEDSKKKTKTNYKKDYRYVFDSSVTPAEVRAPATPVETKR